MDTLCAQHRWVCPDSTSFTYPERPCEIGGFVPSPQSAPSLPVRRSETLSLFKENQRKVIPRDGAGHPGPPAELLGLTSGEWP